MSAAEPSAGSTDNATESPTADSNETHTDPAATNGQRPASATDQEDGHSNGNSHHTAQQNGQTSPLRSQNTGPSANQLHVR